MWGIRPFHGACGAGWRVTAPQRRFSGTAAFAHGTVRRELPHVPIESIIWPSRAMTTQRCTDYLPRHSIFGNPFPMTFETNDRDATDIRFGVLPKTYRWQSVEQFRR